HQAGHTGSPGNEYFRHQRLTIPRTSGLAAESLGDIAVAKMVKKPGWWSAVLGLALSTVILPTGAAAQDRDQQDDPPSRVARIGYMEGSVSFQPAGEPD